MTPFPQLSYLAVAEVQLFEKLSAQVFFGLGHGLVNRVLRVHLDFPLHFLANVAAMATTHALDLVLEVFDVKVDGLYHAGLEFGELELDCFDGFLKRRNDTNDIGGVDGQCLEVVSQ